MQELLKKMLVWLAAKTPLPVLATVTSVDEENQFCDVDPLDGGAPIENVQLSALPSDETGVLITPSIGSVVLVAWLDNGKTGFVAAHTQVDKITLNGEELGGLVNWPELKTELEVERARVDALYDAINKGIPAAGAADGGAGLQTSMKGMLASQVTKGDFDGLENEIVKHG